MIRSPAHSRIPFGGKAAALMLALAAASTAAAEQTSANLALTSDYVWRGSTQSHGDPAVQAGFKATSERGFYASAWGSSVDFGPAVDAGTELDFVAGWAGQLSPDWALDVSATRYHYAGSKPDLDWTEAGATLTWKQNYWLQLGHSGNALASGTTGTYGQIGARIPLGDKVRIEAAVGHYWLDQAYADDYTHGQLGIVWAFHGPCELRLTGHDTDSAAKRLFPDMAGPRLEVALQAAF